MKGASPLPPWWTIQPKDIAAFVGLVVVIALTAWWILARPGVSLHSEPTTLTFTPSSEGVPPFSSEVLESPPPSSVTEASFGTARPTPPVRQGGEGETMMTLHVVGAVSNPGIVHVPVGTRLYAVIAQAGGLRADADVRTINLAQEGVDGQQVWVRAIGEEGPGVSSPAAGATGSLSGPAPGGEAGQRTIHLNGASQAELETLPGIGPKTAAAIVAYREEHGPFAAVEELEAVPGIGPRTVSSLREWVEP